MFITCCVKITQLVDDGNHDGTSAAVVCGDLLSLPWNPNLPRVAWERGRVSVLRFEVTRGAGQPAEWTGFVPTAGLAHRPGVVLERAIKLTGRVGADPPMSARSMGSEDNGNGCGVTLEVAMTFRQCTSGSVSNANGDGKITNIAGQISPDSPKIGTQDTSVRERVKQAMSGSISPSPFHEDVQRNPAMGGELVVHCLKARNLIVPRCGQNSAARDVDPEMSLTVVPDGETVSTCTHVGGGRHPLWNQVKTEDTVCD